LHRGHSALPFAGSVAPPARTGVTWSACHPDWSTAPHSTQRPRAARKSATRADEPNRRQATSRSVARPSGANGRPHVGPARGAHSLGLLEAAVHRPRASVLGQDAYPDLFTKAAAVLHSLARNHPLVDGNKRLAWLATYVFCAKNGADIDAQDDPAYDLVVAVASGSLDDIGDIARVLELFA
jgi:death-on-curing protein